MEWFFEPVLNRKTNSFSVTPEATCDVETDCDSPPTLFSSKWEALLKILLVWVFWRSRSILYSQWQTGYWYLHWACLRWAWGGQASKSTLARSIVVVTWWSSAAFAQYSCVEPYVPRQTNLENYSHLQSDIIHASLNCLWFVHSLKVREPSCFSFPGIELLCQGRKNFTPYSGWQTQNPWKTYTCFSKSRNKIHLIGVCTLSDL